MTNNKVKKESNNCKSLHDLYGVKHLEKHHTWIKLKWEDLVYIK